MRSGRFHLPELRGPRQVLWVEHGGYPELRADDVPTGTADLRLSMKPGGGLAGTVVTAAGQPVTEYDLRVVPAALASETPAAAATRRMNRRLPTFAIRDPGGRFAIDRLEAGAYELVAVAPGAGLHASWPSVDVAAGRTRAGLRLVARPGLTVRGQVVDADGHPVTADLGVLQLDGYHKVAHRSRRALRPARAGARRSPAAPRQRRRGSPRARPDRSGGGERRDRPRTRRSCPRHRISIRPAAGTR